MTGYRRFTPFCLALIAPLLSLPLAAQTPTYRDLSQPFTVRARDLVSRMTLEEKVSQMQNGAAAIPRLGIPSYDWWSEALHGVARAGVATVFPQAIGLAATWDDSLMHQVATVISDEGRAKYYDAQAHDEHGTYHGLTFWSPNINLFRDPRWGRGQETYGEDPYLSGRMAVQFIRGMQGDDPKYLKVVATVKHFDVHSGPEPDRHTFDAVVSDRDLHESYLPQFRAGVEQGGAYSLMCAYNRIDHKAACGSDLLLTDILRDSWGFKGYVVSDCGAISDIWERHHVVATVAEAAALGVRSGDDLSCGDEYRHLVDAVHRGLISESAIDTSVYRLMLARMKLGMFDPPDSVPWSKLGMNIIDDSAHRALALQAAEESIVLLRNQGGLLPLAKGLRTIAVIGPNADQASVLAGNYHGTPANPITPLRGVREALGPHTDVIYARGSDLVSGLPIWDGVPAEFLGGRGNHGAVREEVFASRDTVGKPVATLADTAIAADWGAGAPRAGLDSNNFAVRWTATFTPPTSGVYRLGLKGAMRYTLALDDSVIVRSRDPRHGDEYQDSRLTGSDSLTLTGGRHYRITVVATDSTGPADLSLVWVPPASWLASQAVDAARRADAVVLVLGISPQLEGEESGVHLDGFSGGDRTRIDLPDAQEQLLRQVAAVGKPTVLVLLNGSALAVNWANEHIPAIVEAWYPGESGGTAIARVLFGDYNPGGRLPVTFYHSVADLPPFDDYDMAGHTYRFYDGPVLYPFGFGLSYTTFAYDSLRTDRDTLFAGDTLGVSVDVTNTGTRAGDEVVQLYVQHLGSAVPRPREDLRDFQRVHLAPGETRTVHLRLAAASLAYWNAAGGGWTLEGEPIRLEVGSSSADIRADKTVRVAVEH